MKNLTQDLIDQMSKCVSPNELEKFRQAAHAPEESTRDAFKPSNSIYMLILVLSVPAGIAVLMYMIVSIVQFFFGG